MPLIAIKEVLAGTMEFDLEGERGSYAILQKKINLEPGFKYVVKNVQVFNENGRPELIPAGMGPVEGESFFAQMDYVTHFPIILTGQSFGYNFETRSVFQQNGPYMGDDATIFKKLTITNDEGPMTSNNNKNPPPQVFPHPQLEDLTAKTLYSPQIYLTCIQTGSFTSDNFVQMSYYIEVEKKRCSKLESMLGVYVEHLNAQARLRTRTGNAIIPSDSQAGRTFPSWQFGGKLPSRMATSNILLSYFNNVASADYQNMQVTGEFQRVFDVSSTMSAYDEPFGSFAAPPGPYLGQAPDWLSFGLNNVAGLTTGPIRSYPPPLKFTGNGNTVMYDNDGQPASIIT